MNEIQTWIYLAFTVGGSVLAWLIFWLRFSEKITIARSKAESAEKDAAGSKTVSEQAHLRITAMAAEFGMYRERVATDYVSKEAMRELKTELVAAINKVGDKVDQVLSGNK